MVDMSFDVYMNWPCVKIDPTQSAVINEKPHAAAKFGTDKNEGVKTYERIRKKI